MKALVALAGAVFTAAACYALGSVIAARVGVRLRRIEKFPLAFVLGASRAAFGDFCSARSAYRL